MDIGDILKGPDLPRPVTPDMDRIMEIVLETRAITSENKNDPDAFMRLWREHINKFIDFDSLTYQAMQVAFELMEIRTGLDFVVRVKGSDGGLNRFIQILQGFFDGFLLGSEFQQRGGHRD